MTLKRIEDHILEKAQSEARAVTDAARQDAEARIRAGRDEIDRAFQADVARLEAELAQELERELAALGAERRMEVLRMKSDLLDRIFRRAAEKLAAGPDYWKRVREEMKSLAGREGQVLCSPGHKTAVARILSELGRETGAKMPPLGEEPAKITAGVVLRGKDFDMDLSLDAELASLREEILPELIRKAFPDV